MNKEELKSIWKKEEEIAHIKGWDFSHINGRCNDDYKLPWDYEKTVKKYLTTESNILDFDTGGGEFLLSLNHPFNKTSATEGYKPNVLLCQEKLLPLGIDFKKCSNPAKIPFDDESFDIIINRHGSFDAKELHRLLKKGGIFITEQVGADNDKDLVEMVLTKAVSPYPEVTLKKQKKVFEDAGFNILEADEAYRPMTFSDVGAFVWFAHIIEWEFPGFSVDKCFEQLLEMQKTIENKGFIEGTVHRFLLVAKK